MKEGWEVKPLSSVLEIQNGYAFNSKEFSPSGAMPLIRIRDLKGGLETVVCYDGNYDAKYVVKKGDFLIGMDGEFGCYEWRGADALLNQRVCRLQGFSTVLDPRFLFYGINKYLKDIEDVTGYTTVKHISARQIKAIKFPLPPLAEQKRIVAVLDVGFEGIDLALAAATKNLKNARELFETTLNTTFTQKGEGWVETTLGDLVNIKHGFAFKSHFFTETGDFVLLTPGNFYESGGYRDRGQKQKFYTGDIPEGYLLDEGAMLIAMTEQAVGLLGSSMIVPESGKFLHNQRLGLIEVKRQSGWNNQFFSYLFSSIGFRAGVQDSASGLKVRHTSPTKLKSISVSYPNDVDEQRKISSLLDSLLSETQRLEALYQKKIDALKDLKQSLLQRAFAGELTADPQPLEATG